jgi:predicted nucleic acid-binding protein
MKVGIDTNFLIHLFARNPTDDPDLLDLRRRARLLFDILLAEDHDIICPTVVGSEWLCGIDPTHHPASLAEIERTFVLVTLDPPAMRWAAALWQQVRGLPKDEQPSRVVLKADALVIGSLKAAGAGRFYSHDVGARRWANMIGLQAHDYPTTSPNLFAEYNPEDC